MLLNVSSDARTHATKTDTGNREVSHLNFSCAPAKPACYRKSHECDVASHVGPK